MLSAWIIARGRSLKRLVSSCPRTAGIRLESTDRINHCSPVDVVAIYADTLDYDCDKDHGVQCIDLTRQIIYPRCTLSHDR
jgi:hypothetical protein